MQNFEKSFALLIFISIFAIPNDKGIQNRGVAQLASASGLGPEGPVFESQYPDFKSNYQLIVAFFCISLNLVSEYRSRERER